MGTNVLVVVLVGGWVEVWVAVIWNFFGKLDNMISSLNNYNFDIFPILHDTEMYLKEWNLCKYLTCLSGHICI